MTLEIRIAEASDATEVARRALGHTPKLLAFLVLMALCRASCADDCPISDWPLDLPQGQATMVQVLQPTAAVVTRVIPTRVSSAAAQQRSMAMAPTAPADAHPNPPRDWRGSRAAAPTEQQRLMYAVMDGDAAAVKKYLKSPQVRVNAQAALLALKVQRPR